MKHIFKIKLRRIVFEKTVTLLERKIRQYNRQSPNYTRYETGNNIAWIMDAEINARQTN